LAKTQAIGEMEGKTQAIGQEGRREAKPTPRDRVRHEDEGFFLDRCGEARRRGREAPTGKRQAEAWWREVEKEGALAMAGVREREASAGMERVEGQAAAKAQAERGRRGGECASTHLATSETEDRWVSPSADWYKRVGCQPGERVGPAERLPVCGERKMGASGRRTWQTPRSGSKNSRPAKSRPS
jgi:hypothetical protein